MLNHVAAKDLFKMVYFQFVLFLRYIYVYLNLHYGLRRDICDGVIFKRKYYC